MKNKGQEKFARKIAAAIFESIRNNSASDLDTVEQLLLEISSITSNSLEVKSALLNPSILKNDKVEILSALAEQSQYYSNLNEQNKGILKNTFKVIVEHAVADKLTNITTQFSALLRALKRLAAIQVSSAFDYSTEEKTQFQALLTESLGLTPEISWEISPELIGGTVVKVRDQVLDSSVRGALKNLKAALL